MNTDNCHGFNKLFFFLYKTDDSKAVHVEAEEHRLKHLFFIILENLPVACLRTLFFYVSTSDITYFF